MESEEESGAQLGEEIIDALLKKAKETDGNKSNDLIEVSVEPAEDQDDILLTIPEREFSRLAEETSASFGLKTPFVKITFDNKALDTIAETERSGDIRILANKDLDQDGRPIYDVKVKKGEAAVEDLQGGKAFVTAPYQAKPEENENAIVVYGIDEDGSRKIMRGRYDSEQESMVFRTGYFYKFVVAHNLVEYDDVEDTSWYKDSIEFIAAREITQGIDENNFGPQHNLTRAQFVVLLLNAYQVETAGAEELDTDNFADVGETYYTDHLLTAKALGIVKGVGNNEFAPEREITRQEMFVILYNVLQLIDEMPEEVNANELAHYFDADAIAEWAEGAAAALIKTGTIEGYANKLMPQATSTRAEMAQVIYNLQTR